MLNDLTALRARGFARHPAFRNDVAAHADLRSFVERALTRAQNGGAVYVRPGPDGASAAVLAWHEAEAWHGGSGQFFLVDADDDGAAMWTTRVLAELEPTFGPDADITLHAHQRIERQWCLDHGFGVDALIFGGEPAGALARLSAAGPPPAELQHLGLALEPCRSDHVDALVALKRRVFTEHPEFCWFGATEPFLRGFRAELEQAPESVEVVVRDGEVLGLIGCRLEENPLWGRSGGMDLVLDPALQGLGIARVAYRRILERLVSEGACWFKGGTSQPPVMHLARVMGRPLIQLNLRTAAPLPLAWFAEALTQADGGSKDHAGT